MEAATRVLLGRVSAACRQVGSSNDLQDRGGAAEATAMREGAWQTIADALAAAFADDRERIECLFGPDPLRCFNQILWGQSEDYITWIHVTLGQDAARSGVAVTLRSLDGGALGRAPCCALHWRPQAGKSSRDVS